MPAPLENKPDPKEPVIPPGSSPANDGAPDGPEGDEHYKKELADLEAGKGNPAAPAAPAGGKTPDEERRQAEFNLKSTAKRLKELGGDPTAALADGQPPAPPAAPATPPVDTGKFATKDDLLAIEVRNLTRSEAEFNLTMWYVRNKELSVKDSHLLANKGKVSKALSEITRANTTIPANAGGGPGGDRPVTREPVDLTNEDKQRLIQSGMKYDPAQKAWVGVKTRLRWDGEKWVNERIAK